MSSPPNSIAFMLPENIVFSKDYNQFLLQMTKFYTDIAKASNARDIGIYDTVEKIIGQKYFDPSNSQGQFDVYRKVIECGALPNAASKAVAHGISGLNNDCMITRIYGMARQPAGALPRPFFIPMPNSGNYQVEIMADVTNINITTGLNLAAFTYSFVVVEYFFG